MSSLPILIVGSMAFDDLELPTGAFKDVVGGSATYGAYAATTFANVRLVAVVGEDFSDSELTRLGARGADTTGIERAAGKTFRWAGRYSQNLSSRETLDTQLNVFADFSPKIPAAFKDSALVLLGNIHPALQIRVLDQVTSPKLVVADTMNFWIDGELSTLLEMMKRIDMLVINEEEVRQLAGEHNVAKAAAAVLKLGPKQIIVKRGEYGALLFDKEGAFFAPAYPLEEVVDPTGAGDSFAGGLLGHLALSGDVSPLAMRKAIMVASACASFCVEAVGTQRLATLTRTEVGTRLDAFRKLQDFGGGPLPLCSHKLQRYLRRIPMRFTRSIALAASMTAALAAFACSSEKSDEGVTPTPVGGGTAGSGGGTLGGCYPTDPKCTITGSKCMALTDVSMSKKKTLRISQLKVGKPSALASTTINFTIIGPAVTIQDNEACHLRPGTKAGTFNWLMEFDLTDPANATLRTGGARPVKDPTAGFCFLSESIQGISLAPQTIKINYDTATGKFSTGEGKALTVPIFLDQAGALVPILLPLQGVKITNATLSENGNCIGRFRGDPGELDSACQTQSSNPTDPQAFQFEKGADLEGYITAEEADKVKIVDLSQSLCSFLSNTREPCPDDAAFKCCRRDTAGKIDFTGASGKPDFSSTAQAACSGSADCDAYLLGTELSAASVKINDSCN